MTMVQAEASDGQLTIEKVVPAVGVHRVAVVVDRVVVVADRMVVVADVEVPGALPVVSCKRFL